MTRIPYADEDELAAHKDVFDLVAMVMGFVPNSMKVMARRPDILNGFLALSSAVLGPNTKVPQPLKQLVAYAASLSAGCLYCQAHTAHSGERAGLDAEKLEQAWNYERSPLFSEAERAAMRFAQSGASVPNAVTDADFETLRQWFDDDEITEILSVVSLFGFLNRWNDTLATTLENSPSAFGTAHLSGTGWASGKHGEMS